jgi:small-conductance mechanosensitive channel
VLKTPDPFAVFNGFGDNFLDFTLYYWIPGSLFFKAKTAVALAVHDAINKAGIKTPRPQRDIDVRVLPDEIKKRRVSKAEANPKSSTPKESRQSGSVKKSSNKE